MWPCVYIRQAPCAAAVQPLGGIALITIPGQPCDKIPLCKKKKENSRVSSAQCIESPVSLCGSKMNSFIHVHRKREENLLAQPYYIQRLFTVTTHQLRAPISFILLFFPLSNIHVFPSYYYFSFCLTLSAT